MLNLVDLDLEFPRTLDFYTLPSGWEEVELARPARNIAGTLYYAIEARRTGITEADWLSQREEKLKLRVAELELGREFFYNPWQSGEIPTLDASKQSSCAAAIEALKQFNELHRLYEELGAIQKRLHILGLLDCILRLFIHHAKRILRRDTCVATIFVAFEEFFFTHGEPRPPADPAQSGLRRSVLA